MSTDQRALLDTLIERWQEVADAYKPEDMDGEWDDTTRRYQHYRHAYLKAIRDLQEVLDTGQIPCPLMSVEERRRGDCGHEHQDDSTAGRKNAPRAYPVDTDATQFQQATNVVSLHLAEAFLDGKSEEVRTWARGLAYELKRERIDIADAIGAHMQRMALGGLTSEVPF